MPLILYMYRFPVLLHSTALAFALLLASSSLHAQVDKFIDRSVDRIGNRVDNKVDSRVRSANTKVDQTIDKTVDKNLDRVLEPNKNKTTTPSSSTTSGSSNGGSNPKPSTSSSSSSSSSSTSSKTGSKAPMTHTEESPFVGSFQWEVKRYKADKLVSGGHTILDFYVRPMETALHLLDPSKSNARQYAYLLNRNAAALSIIDEAAGTVSKSAATSASAPIISVLPTNKNKTIEGISCAEYKGTSGDITLTVWADESQRAPMLHSLKQGIGTEARAEFALFPSLANLKVPVREALWENKKTGEKTQIWLNKVQKTAPEDKAFDQSRYLQK